MTRIPSGRGWRYAVLSVLLAASAARSDVSGDAIGSVVRSIDFDCPAAIDRDDFLRELPLKVGERLSREAIEESIEWLRRKRIFDAIRVDGAATNDHSDVVFHLVPTRFIVAIEVRGARALDRDALLRRARLREDEPVSKEKLEAAERRLVELYAEQGFAKPRLEIGTVDESPGKLRIVVRIEEGPPIRVAALSIEGLPADLEDDARRAVSFRAGDIAPVDTLGKGQRALLSFVRRHGYYEAEVVASETRDETGRAFVYRVSAGPRFELTVDGNRAIPTVVLLTLTDLESRPVITNGTWQLMAIRMRERYREDGFEFADVRVSSDGEDPRRVRFQVDEGPQVHVRSVRIDGNRAASRSEIEAVMKTSAEPSRFAWLFGSKKTGLFRRDIVASDVEAIRALYATRGFLAVAVRDQEAFADDRSAVDVVIAISEGRETRVGSVDVSPLPDGQPLDVRLKLEPDAPFHADALESDRREVSRALGKLGFVDAQVTAVVDPPIASGDVETVAIHHRFDAGQAVRIRRVIVQGNHYTRDSVVRHALPFAAGDLLDPAKLATGQTDVFRLGLFRSVAIRPLDDAGSTRDIGIEVGERPGGEFQYGFGYDTRAGLRTFVQVGHRNLRGNADQLALRAELNLAPSDFVPDEYVVSLEGKEPHFLSGPFDLKASAARQQSERSIDEFSIRRTTFAAGFERELVRALRGTLMLEFEDSDIFDVHPDAVLTGKDVGRLRTVTLNPLVVYDGRDDAFAPTRGVFESLRLRYGSPPFGSQVHFFKLAYQHSQYVPLAEGWTWLYAARFGFARPIGTSSEIPLRERFFLGGRTSVRGYEENGIGPRGTDGNPIGGDLLVNLNTELRFPLVFGAAGAVFVDGGGLYLQDRAVSIADFRKSIGPGLRYQTPIGTVSLDYGFKLLPRRGESIGEVHFSIGNIF